MNFSVYFVIGVLAWVVVLYIVFLVGRRIFEYIHFHLAGIKANRLRAQELVQEAKIDEYLEHQTQRKEQERLYEEKRCRMETERIASVTTLLKLHKTALVSRYLQLVTQDRYGNYQFDRWFDERDYFIENVLYKNLPHIRETLDRGTLKRLVDDTTIGFAHEPDQLDSFGVDALHPIEFEQWCAKKIAEQGWAVSLTKASGDQGVDIIADKDHLRVAIQCKKYASSVGNAAVQEIFSGMRHVNAHFGMVVTNSTFTRQAEELASSTEIKLLHYSALNDFNALIQSLGTA